MFFPLTSSCATSNEAKSLSHGGLSAFPTMARDARRGEGEGTHSEYFPIHKQAAAVILRSKKSFTWRTFGIPHDGKRCEARREGTRSEAFPSHKQAAEVISQEAKSLSHGGLSAFPTMERDARRGRENPLRGISFPQAGCGSHSAKQKVFHMEDFQLSPRWKETRGEGRGNPLRGISFPQAGRGSHFPRSKKSFTWRTFGIPHDGKRCKARGEGTRSEAFPSHKPAAEVISQEILNHHLRAHARAYKYIMYATTFLHPSSPSKITPCIPRRKSTSAPFLLHPPPHSTFPLKDNTPPPFLPLQPS